MEEAEAAPAITGRAALAVLRRPWLWLAAVAAMARLAPRGWWRHWPPSPLPDRHYLHFRLVTQYGGDGSHAPDPHDLVTYLAWQRAWRRAAR